MTTIHWRPELLLNVPEIDRQHQGLLDCAGRLCEGIEEGQSPEQIRSLLLALVETTKRHFEYEESMMLAYAFDGYAAHRAKHEELLQMMHEVDKDLLAGVIHQSQAQVLALFVDTWATQHICESDKQFAEFLTSRGIDPRPQEPAESWPVKQTVLK